MEQSTDSTSEIVRSPLKPLSEGAYQEGEESNYKSSAYTFTIENFSDYFNEKSSQFSCVYPLIFTEDNVEGKYEFLLELVPFVQHNEEKHPKVKLSNYIDLYLICIDKSANAEQPAQKSKYSNLKFRFEFSILNSQDSKCKTNLHKGKFPLDQINAYRKVHAIRKYIKHKYLSDEANGCLPDNSLKFTFEFEILGE